MRISTIVGIVCSAAASCTTWGSVIYDSRIAGGGSLFTIAEIDETSSSMEVAGNGREADWRIGDQISFAGTDRFLTTFSTRVQAFAGTTRGITLDVQLTIYQNNAGLPGAVIWSGTASQVSLPIGGLSLREVSFTPNILVPDSVCFAVAFSSITAASGETRIFGVESANIPSIGSSPVTTIHQLSSDGSWYIQDDSASSGGIFQNVDAHVEAIPAPSAFIGLTLLSGVAAARRRRAAV